MRLTDALGNLLGAFTPERKLERMKARFMVDAFERFEKRQKERRYEGASTGRRTGGWVTWPTGANAAALGQLQRLRDRSRDLIRNNAWADHAVAVYEDEIVGTGIVPRFVHPSKEIEKKAKALWLEHCCSTAIDADGRLDIYGMQSLMVRTIFESGECLLRRRRRQLKDGLPLPFVVELLEPDHLDDTRDTLGVLNGSRTKAGIQLSAIGKREGYWLLPDHPGEMDFVRQESKLVPASEVLHAYRMRRPKQLRGVPALASVVIPLKDQDDYEDSEAVRKKVTSCLTAFVTDPAESDSPRTTASGVEELPADLESGAIVNLPGGKTVTFSTPPSDANFEGYIRQSMRKIAAGTGLTYEALSGDWSQVNYSSARMGWLQNGRAVDSFRWKIVVPQLLDPFVQWFLEAAIIAGKLPDEPFGILWTPPRRAMLDPKTEVPARRDAVRAGQQSLSEQLREDGMDPQATWPEMAEDFRQLRELGLNVESDPSVPLRGGPPAQDSKQSKPDAKAEDGTD